MISQLDSKATIGVSDTWLERIGADLTFKDASNAVAATLTELRLQRRSETVNLDLKDATFFKTPFPELVSRAGTSNSATVLGCFAFDDTTEEFVTYDIYLPQDLNPAGTVNIRFQWLPATASSNNVVWKIYHTPIDAGQSFDVAMSTYTITSAGSATTDVISESVITDSVSSLAWVAGDHLIFHVSRDAANGSDTLTGDAHLVSIAIELPLKNSGSQGSGGDYQLKFANIANSSTISNTATETNFDQNYPIAATTLGIGNVLEVIAGGRLSTKSGSNQGITFRVKYGTVNLASFYVEIPPSLSNIGWYIQTYSTVRTTGATGTAVTNGFTIARQGTTTSTDDIQAFSNNGASTVDTTTDTTAYVSADWDTADTLNSVTLETLDVAIKASLSLGGGSVFSGDMASTGQKYLNNSLTSQPVSLRDNDGLSIQNSSGTEGQRKYIIRQTTTNTATATEVTIDDSGTIFLPAIASGEVYGYIAYITAKGTAGTNINKTAFYKLEFLISRTTGTTTLVNSILELIGEEIGAWDFTVVADTGNNRPAVKVTGDAATTITWRGWVDSTKIS